MPLVVIEKSQGKAVGRISGRPLSGSSHPEARYDEFGLLSVIAARHASAAPTLPVPWGT